MTEFSYIITYDLWYFCKFLSCFQLTEQLEILTKEETDPKAREIFHEASRTLEMANPDDLQSLGETMFKGLCYHIIFESYKDLRFKVSLFMNIDIFFNRYAWMSWKRKRSCTAKRSSRETEKIYWCRCRKPKEVQHYWSLMLLRKLSLIYWFIIAKCLIYYIVNVLCKLSI